MFAVVVAAVTFVGVLAAVRRRLRVESTQRRRERFWEYLVVETRAPVSAPRRLLPARPDGVAEF